MQRHFKFQAWEGGKVKNIISNLHQLILDRRDRAEKERILAEYFVDSLGTHNFWALRMLFVEFLNLINVVFNIYFVDIFLQVRQNTTVKPLEFQPTLQ